MLLTHQSSMCCDKNSFTYKVTKRPNWSVLGITILMLYLIIGQNFILNYFFILNNTSIFTPNLFLFAG